MLRQNSSDDFLLIVMRHGEAESLRIDDKSRQLTASGRRQVAQAAQWLVENYCPEARVDLALVSPYRRARQTFDLVNLDVSVGKALECDDIVPEGNPQIAHDYLDTLLSAAQGKVKPVKSVLLVSHMPFVSYFLDEISTVKTNSLFATASMAIVEYRLNSHNGQLLSHYQGD
ncbi:phosphohistidine phosphatase SixA [Aestuariibacter sp. A3R04]|uniref:phosphohistidine phosphatase SixA n=1 Tax=Aestuariibacter sp. A3R04 TaxID=2841571 RepID=UPI001C08DAE6|nr:phosphohistidine phosphatase SixA [Aestuariibacter sp. A3R04]MBU3022407.1 phosphohistidine phosphatase SixA [Aestuariibacter sp. A3R04]